jgi:peptidoglycan/LPS O-acetylase OafA/YrhL
VSQPFPPAAAAYSARSGYRKDIEGLRGIAVAGVVLCHAFPTVLPGGFAGVDIFFVISGFLISRLLIGELQTDTFRLTAFYARRARRLFPSLAILLFASLVAGWFLLLPDEFRQLGKHTAAGAGFVSNFAYLGESGYFDTEAARKPLLHLWSLGIEEQFYLTWPLFLGVIWKSRRRPLLWIGLGATVSFLINLALRTRPSSYYLPFTRCWELLAGCSLVFIGTRVRSLPRWMRNLIAAIGLASLAVAFAVLNPQRTYPGYWALLPVIGTWLLISAGVETLVNGPILQLRPLVIAGLISYPLYLWHWSLLSFARILGWTGAGPAAVLSAIAVALAWLTWRYAEQPVRARPPGRVVAVLTGAVVVAGVAGVSIFATNGVLGRPQTAMAASEIEEIQAGIPVQRCPGAPEAFQICFQSGGGPARGVILGDSHALALQQGLAAVEPAHNWLALGNPSCPPVTGILARRFDRPPCAPRMEAAIEYLSQQKIHLVILAFFGYFSENSDFARDQVNNTDGPASFRLESGTPGLAGFTPKENALLAGLRATADKLLAGGHRVVLVIDVPELPFFPIDCIPRPFAAAARCILPRSVVDQRQRGLRRVVAQLNKELPGIEVFDPLPLLCGDGDCQPVHNGMALYKDSHHLSVRGSRLVAEALLRQIAGAKATSF